MPEDVPLSAYFAPFIYVGDIEVDDVLASPVSIEFEFDRPVGATGSPNIGILGNELDPPGFPLLSGAVASTITNVATNPSTGETTGQVTVSPIGLSSQVDVKVKVMVIYPIDPTILEKLRQLLGLGGKSAPGGGGGQRGGKGKGKSKGKGKRAEQKIAPAKATPTKAAATRTAAPKKTSTPKTAAKKSTPARRAKPKS
ncbi:MAG: hypothetical protein U0794_17555 [Isosphaeraceae bacterium]